MYVHVCVLMCGNYVCVLMCGKYVHVCVLMCGKYVYVLMCGKGTQPFEEREEKGEYFTLVSLFMTLNAWIYSYILFLSLWTLHVLLINLIIHTKKCIIFVCLLKSTVYTRRTSILHVFCTVHVILYIVCTVSTYVPYCFSHWINDMLKNIFSLLFLSEWICFKSIYFEIKILYKF